MDFSIFYINHRALTQLLKPNGTCVVDMGSRQRRYAVPLTPYINDTGSRRSPTTQQYASSTRIILIADYFV